MSQPPRWLEAYIGLGSNLDDPLRQVRTAAQEISALPDIRDHKLSPLYSSHPVGPQDQPDYINAVMRIHTNLAPMDLLRRLQAIENLHGRTRSTRWGARTLDLDLLLYDDLMLNEPELIVPHVELANRAFVLYPLADIAPADLSIAGLGPLGDLLAKCSAEGIKRIEP
ncbi:2-amino-4-hydroxy-6-hydroxymethyldihydropteridine diphosphokinase [Methylomonas methanica]|uniref:2-amino-4-hydroxy-6-hydroxymethyldihydropteridine pyrophosphokinase n=1 Tax=Methylomonas methanica (strain DSM 25384 / MC09) TaxID=857087 RepID=G0A0M8_METMM|nr:2-amino-4-hydroxy-6-hydroxymethyldihydropteridine diphosphokinase [Methylomonas methanica]AEF98804.1 2-amino-4-hydroxy-6-hydroxymethyldihydropteridine pyrophosphokinase [Methylomonas methanica MC09]